MATDPRLAQYAIFYVATLLFFSVGAITTAGLPWYASLTVPAWMPSQLMTSVIWLMLFLSAALSMALFWKQAGARSHSRLITALYLGNAGLVLLWNYLFFGAEEIVGAYVAAVLVSISLLALTALLWKTYRTAAYVLIPYLVWMFVALTFSYQIMLLN